MVLMHEPAVLAVLAVLIQVEEVEEDPILVIQDLWPAALADQAS
jgi:hypothetical protein